MQTLFAQFCDVSAYKEEGNLYIYAGINQTVSTDPMFPIEAG